MITKLHLDAICNVVYTTYELRLFLPPAKLISLFGNGQIAC